MSENPAVLRAQVDDLRVRIAAEKEAKSRADLNASDEYRASILAAERDALRAELAGMTGVEVSSVSLVDSAPAVEPVAQPEPAPPPTEEATASGGGSAESTPSGRGR